MCVHTRTVRRTHYRKHQNQYENNDTVNSLGVILCSVSVVPTDTDASFLLSPLDRTKLLVNTIRFPSNPKHHRLKTED